jgi:hypothetical protein
MRSWVDGAGTTATSALVILESLVEGSVAESDGEDERLDGVRVIGMVLGILRLRSLLWVEGHGRGRARRRVESEFTRRRK